MRASNRKPLANPVIMSRRLIHLPEMLKDCSISELLYAQELIYKEIGPKLEQMKPENIIFGSHVTFLHNLVEVGGRVVQISRRTVSVMLDGSKKPLRVPYRDIQTVTRP